MSKAAIDWALAAGGHDLCLRLSGALQDYWLMRGHLPEGRRLTWRAPTTDREDRVL
jgi:hypothetical protein